jgi:hypothetical protein
MPLKRVLAPGEHHVELRLTAEGSSPASVTVHQVSANTFTMRALWQNVVQPLDVNGDSDISPIDVLLIINELNDPRYSDRGTNRLPSAVNVVGPYLDTNGDNAVTPIDALLVINWLNRPALVEAESSPPDVRVFAKEANGKMSTSSLGILGLSPDAPPFIHPFVYSSVSQFSATSAGTAVDASAAIVANSQITDAASPVRCTPLDDMDLEVADFTDPLDTDSCDWDELLTALASELRDVRRTIA